jgi:hypothetical protein
MAVFAAALSGAQILSGRLAAPAVCNDVEGHLLALVEGAQTRAFDRADVNEDILVAAFRLNEAEAFLVVKPLYSSLVHGSSSFGTCVFKPRRNAAGSFEIFGEKVVSQARCKRRGQVVRPKLDTW